MSRIFARLAMLANDLLFIAMMAVFFAGWFWVWKVGPPSIGAYIGAGLMTLIVLYERVKSGRWWWNYFAG